MKHYFLLLILLCNFSCKDNSLYKRLHDLSGYWNLIEFKYDGDLNLENGNFFFFGSGGINFPGRSNINVVESGEWYLVSNAPDSLVINVTYSDTLYCGNWIIKNIRYGSGERDLLSANYMELHQGNKILKFNRGQR